MHGAVHGRYDPLQLQPRGELQLGLPVHHQVLQTPITFNKEKFCLDREQLEYLRYHLDKALVEPSKDILQSITEFPSPRT